MTSNIVKAACIHRGGALELVRESMKGMPPAIFCAEPHVLLEGLRDQRRHDAGRRRRRRLGWRGMVVALADVEESFNLETRLVEGPEPGHTESIGDARHGSAPVREDLIVADDCTGVSARCSFGLDNMMGPKQHRACARPAIAHVE